MSKNIYSLVLSDDVIEKADQLAYEMHTSRSNLINQILAEHLSCITPEMRMKMIFSHMEHLSVQQFRMLEQTSANIFSLQSRLNYKYKPTILYAIELCPEQDYTGRLKIKLRTQNPDLIAALDAFFRFWISLEEYYFPDHRIEYRITVGRLERSISHTGMDEKNLGRLISEYVQRFDQYLKAWIAGKSIQSLEQQFAQEALLIKQLI
ncbi:MAG: hypothetical protein K2H89_06905 [Oscillospiraceae bacterium]|nr:hypothetical protein [Oscillospiraceae bacterium]